MTTERRTKTGGRTATRCEWCDGPAKGTIWGRRLCSKHYKRLWRLRRRTFTASEWEDVLWLPPGSVQHLVDGRVWPGADDNDRWSVGYLRKGAILDFHALAFGLLVRHPNYYGWEHLQEFRDYAYAIPYARALLALGWSRADESRGGDGLNPSAGMVAMIRLKDMAYSSDSNIDGMNRTQIAAVLDSL